MAEGLLKYLLFFIYLYGVSHTESEKNYGVGSCIKSLGGTSEGNDSQNVNTQIRIANIRVQNDLTCMEKESVTISGRSEQITTIKCSSNKSMISFQDIGVLHIEMLTIEQCNTIVVFNCSEVIIENVRLRNSKGGLLIANYYSVSVINSSFEQTVKESHTSRLILVPNTNSSLVNIRNCTFWRNFIKSKNQPFIPNLSKFTKKTIKEALSSNTETSGAITAIFLQGSVNNNVEVINCTFSENSAANGSALSIEMKAAAQNNFIYLERIIFNKNTATNSGGALFVTLQSPNNSVIVTDCVFTDNNAIKNGGALQISSVQSNERHDRNIIEFYGTRWTNNIARYGAAIRFHPLQGHYVEDGTFPTPTFHNCVFQDNTAIPIVNKNENYQVEKKGKGIVSSVKFNISLNGNVTFTNSIGSAIYISSGSVTMTNSEAYFTNNTGFHGGAISLMGYHSQIQLTNSSVYFLNNTASDMGGAIYQELSDICFILIDMSSITHFEYNIASTSYGHSVFVRSLKQCSSDIMKEVNLTSKTLSTKGRNITVPSNSKVIDYIMPGIPASLNIEIKDDTNTTCLDILHVTIRRNSTDVMIAKNHKFLYNSRKFVLIGPPNTTIELAISLVDRPNTEITFNVTLQDCPPGYTWRPNKNSSSLGTCYCSASTCDDFFMAIHSCNQTNFNAILKSTHWAGYINDNQTQFRTGYCPKGFCVNDTKLTANSVLLPNSSLNWQDLSKYVCRENRTGILCGLCTENHSVYYHTNDYDCGPNKKCNVGLLFFVLSQMLPLTFLFIIIIVLNINLTNGSVNIFVFYFQVFDLLHIGGNGLIEFLPKVHKLLSLIRFIARAFQLDFFALQKFSFCLWKGATTLGIIAINYVTTVYALGLIILTVGIIVPCLHKLKVKNIVVVKGKISSTIIHGLSGFLVLCYFQCTKTSLIILNSTQLAKEKRELDRELRAYYNGELMFFGPGHKTYALLASAFFVVITVLPPLLLLCYPLCYKVLALCKLQESSFTRILCKIIPLEKYRPVFDSFQSTYNDNNRYFAGLFFIYRLTLLMTFAFSRGLGMLYFYLEIQLLLIIVLHALTRPHKNKWHNVLDIFIFTLLAVLNGMTIHNYQNSLDDHILYHKGTTIGTVQVVLSGIPIIMTISYILYHSTFRIKSWLNTMNDECFRNMALLKQLISIIRRRKAQVCSQQNCAEDILEMDDALSLCDEDYRGVDEDVMLNSEYSKCK